MPLSTGLGACSKREKDPLYIARRVVRMAVEGHRPRRAQRLCVVHGRARRR